MLLWAQRILSSTLILRLRMTVLRCLRILLIMYNFASSTSLLSKKKDRWFGYCEVGFSQENLIQGFTILLSAFLGFWPIDQFVLTFRSHRWDHCHSPFPRTPNFQYRGQSTVIGRRVCSPKLASASRSRSLRLQLADTQRAQGERNQEDLSWKSTFPPLTFAPKVFIANVDPPKGLTPWVRGCTTLPPTCLPDLMWSF